MIGLKPKLTRSSGVTKCRRFVAGSALGPSGGSLARDVEVVVDQRPVSPSTRSVYPYSPCTLIGPDTAETDSSPEPFETLVVVTFSTTGCGRCFAFVHR